MGARRIAGTMCCALLAMTAPAAPLNIPEAFVSAPSIATVKTMVVPVTLKNMPSPPVEEEAPEPVNEPKATPKPELPKLYTNEDAITLAKVLWAEARGIESDAEKAAVAWCALNRLDTGEYGDTLTEVLTAPHQFAYKENAPVTEELARLALDVLNRWQDEKRGATDVGRTLPPDYLFFGSTGSKRNRFRKEYEWTGEIWDWSLPDPYEDDNP